MLPLCLPLALLARRETLLWSDCCPAAWRSPAMCHRAGCTGFGSAILNLCVWIIATCAGINSGVLEGRVLSLLTLNPGPTECSAVPHRTCKPTQTASASLQHCLARAGRSALVNTPLLGASCSAAACRHTATGCADRMHSKRSPGFAVTVHDQSACNLRLGSGLLFECVWGECTLTCSGNHTLVVP